MAEFKMDLGEDSDGDDLISAADERTRRAGERKRQREQDASQGRGIVGGISAVFASIQDSFAKRLRAEEADKEVADERSRRLLLQTKHTRSDFVHHFGWSRAPAVCPRIILLDADPEHRGASAYSLATRRALDWTIWTDFGLRVQTAMQDDEFEHMPWNKDGWSADMQARFIVTASGLFDALTETGKGLSFFDRWSQIPVSQEQFNKLLTGFVNPVVAVSSVERSWRTPDGFNRQITNAYPSKYRNIAPATCWDVILDARNVMSMSVVIVHGKSWEYSDGLLTDIENGQLDRELAPHSSPEQVAQKQRLLEEMMTRPPNPHYILELVGEDGFTPVSGTDKEDGQSQIRRFKDTQHFRVFVQDMTVRYKKLRDLAFTSNGLEENKGDILDVRLWSQNWLQRMGRANANPYCSIPPSVGVAREWPWNGTSVLKEWPVEISFYCEHKHSPQQLQAANFMFRLKERWNEQKRSIASLKFHTRVFRSDMKDTTGLFDSDVLQGLSEEDNTGADDRMTFEHVRSHDLQRVADRFAQYMHFPANNQQFHIAMQFMPGPSIGRLTSRDPIVDVTTREFEPKILQPPNAQIAFYRKLEKQGQLLLIRVVTPLQYKAALKLPGMNFMPSDQSYFQPDDPMYDVVLARIAQAQSEHLSTLAALRQISAERPQQTLPSDVNLLIRSFLGGKFKDSTCSNDGCDKRPDRVCGHCDDACYCSDGCYQKHWATHSKAKKA